MIDYLKILESKENRFNKQEELIKKYPYSLICFTLNIPGPEKDNMLIRGIHKEGRKAIEDVLNRYNLQIYYKETRYTETGPEAFISVDTEATELKNHMVYIEDSHPLGRIFDIDVFDKKHNQISRVIIKKSLRKCLLCNDSAIECIRNNKHTYSELIKKIEEMCVSYGL